jgi:hypothetical protein
MPGEADISRETAEMAIKALEKQIPKKPKIVALRDFDYYDCPVCDRKFICKNGKGNVWFFDTRRIYCPNCGQKIDWSESDDVI